MATPLSPSIPATKPKCLVVTGRLPAHANTVALTFRCCPNGHGIAESTCKSRANFTSIYTVVHIDCTAHTDLAGREVEYAVDCNLWTMEAAG